MSESQEAIVAYLRRVGGYRTTADIAIELGLTTKQVRKKLRGLEKAGLVAKIPQPGINSLIWRAV